MLIYRLLVGLVAAVIIKYQVLSWNISGKQDTTSVYYNAGPGLLTSTTIQGGTTDIYYDTRRDYWHLLQHEGALLKQLTRVLEYQGTVNTGAILSYRTISFSPDDECSFLFILQPLPVAGLSNRPQVWNSDPGPPLGNKTKSYESNI